MLKQPVSVIAACIAMLTAPSVLAQRTSAPKSPSAEIVSFAEMVRNDSQACELAINIAILAREVHRQDPNDPTGMSNLQAVKSLEKCAETSRAAIRKLKSESIDLYRPLLTRECRAAVDDLYFAHEKQLASYSAVEADGLKQFERKASVEALVVRSKAIGTKIHCTP